MGQWLNLFEPPLESEAAPAVIQIRNASIPVGGTSRAEDPSGRRNEPPLKLGVRIHRVLGP